MIRILLLVNLALAACAPAPPPVATPASVLARADTVILTGERAFAAAELGYITAAKGIGILADQGVIHGAVAEQVRGYNAIARKALVDGKAAADTAEKARAAVTLFNIADQLNLLKKGR